MVKLLQQGGPLEVTWEVTRRCNMNCAACYTFGSDDNPGRELDPAEAVRFLDQLAGSGVLFLFFDGGEPFVRPDFLELVEAATRRFCVFMSINGTLVTPSVAERLADAGVSAVFVGLQGTTAAAHDFVTSVEGSFDNTVNGIRNLASAGVWTSACLRLTKAALPNLSDYVHFAAGIGASKASLLHLHRVGRARLVYDERSPNNDELRRAIEALYSQPLPIPASHPYYPFVHDCCREFCTVLWNGDVSTCTYVREWKPAIFGNIRESKLIDIWNSERYTNYRNATRLGACTKCEFFGPCGGGCRAMPVAEGLTPFHSDPTCWYSPDRPDRPVGVCTTAPSETPSATKPQISYEKESPRYNSPLVRANEVVIHTQPVWGQNYVYLPDSRRAVALNEVAYAAWSCLDGTLTANDVAEVVSEELAQTAESSEAYYNATLVSIDELISLGCILIPQNECDPVSASARGIVRKREK